MSVNRRFEKKCSQHGAFGADVPEEVCPACDDEAPSVGLRDRQRNLAHAGELAKSMSALLQERFPYGAGLDVSVDADSPGPDALTDSVAAHLVCYGYAREFTLNAEKLKHGAVALNGEELSILYFVTTKDEAEAMVAKLSDDLAAFEPTPIYSHRVAWEANNVRVKAFAAPVTEMLEAHFGHLGSSGELIYGALNEDYGEPSGLDDPAHSSFWVTMDTRGFALEPKLLKRGHVAQENPDYTDVEYLVQPEETLEQLLEDIKRDLPAITKREVEP